MVGINAYRHQRPLKNAVQDAKAVKEALESQGVEVFAIYDCNITELRAATDKFVKALQEGDAAIVFFAGAAVEFHNATRLRATDAYIYQDHTLNALALLDRLGTSCCHSNRDKKPFRPATGW